MLRTEEMMLTVNEVAKKLNLSPLTIYRLIRDGELTAIKIGAGKMGRLRIEEEALQEFIERNRTEPPLTS